MDGTSDILLTALQGPWTPYSLEPSPGHFYSHLCPVLGSNPAPHRGEVNPIELPQHPAAQHNPVLESHGLSH